MEYGIHTSNDTSLGNTVETWLAYLDDGDETGFQLISKVCVAIFGSIAETALQYVENLGTTLERGFEAIGCGRLVRGVRWVVNATRRLPTTLGSVALLFVGPSSFKGLVIRQAAIYGLEVLSSETGLIGLVSKTLWVGQRVSVGLIYAAAAKAIVDTQMWSGAERIRYQSFKELTPEYKAAQKYVGALKQRTALCFDRLKPLMISSVATWTFGLGEISWANWTLMPSLDFSASWLPSIGSVGAGVGMVAATALLVTTFVQYIRVQRKLGQSRVIPPDMDRSQELKTRFCLVIKAAANNDCIVNELRAIRAGDTEIHVAADQEYRRLEQAQKEARERLTEATRAYNDPAAGEQRGRIQLEIDGLTPEVAELLRARNAINPETHAVNWGHANTAYNARNRVLQERVAALAALNNPRIVAEGAFNAATAALEARGLELRTATDANRQQLKRAADEAMTTLIHRLPILVASYYIEGRGEALCDDLGLETFEGGVGRKQINHVHDLLNDRVTDVKWLGGKKKAFERNVEGSAHNLNYRDARLAEGKAECVIQRVANAIEDRYRDEVTEAITEMADARNAIWAS